MLLRCGNVRYLGHPRMPFFDRQSLMREARVNRVSPIMTLVGFLAGAVTAGAQTYPSHPVTMIVPFAAGGPMDTVARVIANGMRAPLGQPVIIENVVGAGGSIGAGRVAHAASDGLTVSYGGWPT